MRRLIYSMVLAVLTAGPLASCTWPPSPTEPPFVGGDSLTVQTSITEGALPPGWDVVSNLGWQAENVQPNLTERVSDRTRSPGRVVFALGQNDGGNGFDATDAQQLTQLAETPHGDACIRWLLPHYAGTDPTHITGIQAVRDWITVYAAAHGQGTFDWRPRAQAHPEYVDPDGIHLTTAGRLAYGQLIQEAMASCG
jgi:GDSL-like lipase/acylhydrolase family protein